MIRLKQRYSSVLRIVSGSERVQGGPFGGPEQNQHHAVGSIGAMRPNPAQQDKNELAMSHTHVRKWKRPSFGQVQTSPLRSSPTLPDLTFCMMNEHVQAGSLSEMRRTRVYRGTTLCLCSCAAFVISAAYRSVSWPASTSYRATLVRCHAASCLRHHSTSCSLYFARERACYRSDCDDSAGTYYTYAQVQHLLLQLLYGCGHPDVMALSTCSVGFGRNVDGNWSSSKVTCRTHLPIERRMSTA